MRGARVFGAVDAVSEAHDLLLIGKRIQHPVLNLFDAANLHQVLDDAFVGAAVQRAFERADGRDNRRIHVRQRRRRHPRRERRSVQFMVGVQDEGHVHRSRRHVVRLCAVQRVKKVAGNRQVRARRDRLQSVAYALKGGNDDRESRRQANGFAQVGGARHVAGLFVVKRQRRDYRAQHVHRVCRLRDGADQLLNPVGELALAADLLFEVVEFAASRQAQIPEQVDDFLERGVLGEVVNVVSGVDQAAFNAVHVAERRLRGDDAFEAGFGHIGFTRHLLCFLSQCMVWVCK